MEGVKVLYDTVLIKEDKTSEGKVLIADSPRDVHPVTKGDVIVVGPGQAYGLPEFQPTTVKPGDKVIFLKDQAPKVKIEKEEYYACRERDILIILSS